MGLIFSGDGDVNVVGVVGSTRDDNDPPARRTRDHSDDDGETNTGIQHRGRGNVYINGRRQ